MANQKNKPLDKDALKQPDEFLVLNTKLMTWVIQHKFLVIGIVVVILIIGGAFSGFKYNSYLKELKTAELTAQAMQGYINDIQAGNADAFKNAGQKFDAIIQDFGNTQNVGYTKVVFANIAYQAKEYEKALASYQAALAGYTVDPVVASNIQNSIAHCYMALENYDKALETFQKVADNPKAVLQDDALYNMGLIYAKLDTPQKSAAAFEQVLTKYPDSIQAQLLKNRPAAN